VAGRTHLVPGQVDVSSFSSSAANKTAVRLWQVRPEGALLISVDAEVQGAATHTHTLTLTPGGCSSGERTVAHQPEGQWFDSGFLGREPGLPRATCQSVLGPTIGV